METSALIVNYKLVTQSNECITEKTRAGIAIALKAEGNQPNAIWWKTVNLLGAGIYGDGSLWHPQLWNLQKSLAMARE